MNRALFWTGLALVIVGLTIPRVVSHAGETEKKFAEVAALLQEAIEEGAFPGCVVAIGSDAGPLWVEGFGHFDYEKSTSVNSDTIYDLASVTKVAGTTVTLMRLAAKGELKVTAPVLDYLPELADAAADDEERAWRKKLTVEHLLRHTGGVASWKPFFRSVNSYDELLQSILETPFESEPGTQYRYSDLGFILLGEIVARAGGKPLADLEQSLVIRPLGMTDTRRNPSPELRLRIPPTERDPESEGFVHGIVHDENARAGGGETGHAGLFSTAGDLSRLAQELLRASAGKSELFPAPVFEAFTARANESSSRGLGWVLASGGAAGFSREALGHTGFTGTSIWIDPKLNLYVILLTNRVHPTRDNHKISRVRSHLAEAVVRAVKLD